MEAAAAAGARAVPGRSAAADAPHVLLDLGALLVLLALLRVALVQLVVPHVAGLQGRDRASTGVLLLPAACDTAGISPAAQLCHRKQSVEEAAAQAPPAPLPAHLALVGGWEAWVWLGGLKDDCTRARARRVERLVAAPSDRQGVTTAMSPKHCPDCNQDIHKPTGTPAARVSPGLPGRERREAPVAAGTHCYPARSAP